MTIAAKPLGRERVVTDPVRVMVVDDSVVVRGLISRWVDEDASLAVVASHRNGRLAVDDIERSDPDVVVLDIEMPEMDGLTALPLMLRKKPSLAVIMASTLTRRNAEISLRALSLGACDYIPKPERNSGIATSADFRKEVLEKIRVLGGRRSAARRRTGEHRGGPPAARPATGSTASNLASLRPQPAGATGAPTPAPATLRPVSSAIPRVVAIGSSTGGPQALARVFEALAPALTKVPVVVVQHMPPTFTAILAEHIGKATGLISAEGRDGEVLEPGRIYIAPGGRHMVVNKTDAGVAIALKDGAPVNFCKPAVDPLFASVSEIFGAGALAVVLTGMGSDGAKGAMRIADNGGTVIAQDEASSVVWGMPGATVQAGAAAAVLPLTEIGPRATRLLRGERR